MTDREKVLEFAESVDACKRYGREATRPWKAVCAVLTTALASMVWLAYSEAKAEGRF